MYFLLAACQHPGVLRVLYFVFLLIDIIFIIVPIGLIIMLMIDFSKAVIAGEDDKAKKSTKIVVKRIIYAVLIFAMPWIVNVFLNFMAYAGISTDYLTCYDNAKGGDFAYFDRLLEEEDKAREEERQKKLEEQRLKNEKDRQEREKANQEKANMQKGASYGSMASRLVKVASDELGKTDSSRYGATGGAPWCGFFTSWALKNTEYNGENLFYDIIEKEQKVQNPASALCSVYNFETSSNLAFHYSQYYANKLGKSSYTPKVGDIIYFNWDKNWNGQINSCANMHYGNSHVGIIGNVTGTLITTYEGNCGGKVCSNTYQVTDQNIIGYGSWYDN